METYDFSNVQWRWLTQISTTNEYVHYSKPKFTCSLKLLLQNNGFTTSEYKANFAFKNPKLDFTIRREIGGRWRLTAGNWLNFQSFLLSMKDFDESLPPYVTSTLASKYVF